MKRAALSMEAEAKRIPGRSIRQAAILSNDSATAGDLEPDICWQAIRSRDRRFDGRFFIGAVTNYVYCRSTCPVPFAKPSNICLFACAAAAEAAGFRPCTRCRPESSPGTPAWLGTSAVVSRALRMIWQGGLNSGNVEALAERVGIGSRQLRRLFLQHLGASPVKVACTHRRHFARHLIQETDLPMTNIALSAGFNSIRQFNHAMKQATGQSPTELRRQRTGTPPTSGGLIVRLPYRPPFHWTAIVQFLKAVSIRGVECCHENVYRRTVEIGDAAGFIEVRHEESESRLAVRIELPKYDSLVKVVERVRQMFDLGADPAQIGSHLSKMPYLKPLVEARPGLRVPGVWDRFELIVTTLLEFYSAEHGVTEPAHRLVQAYGTPVNYQVEGLTHLFPKPETLATADLTRFGFSSSLTRMVRNLAVQMLNGNDGFDAIRNLEEAIALARECFHVDERTAHYIAMRAFGEPDAFPLKDRQYETLAESCRPWRSYAAMHLSVSTDQLISKPWQSCERIVS